MGKQLKGSRLGLGEVQLDMTGQRRVAGAHRLEFVHVSRYGSSGVE
jgi:hypothetical protein